MTRQRGSGEGRLLSLKKFNGFIEIEKDGEQAFAWVEPNVTMEKLVKTTIKEGLVPAVTPEFKGITIGGAIMGAALESSSFRYGQFNDICEEYELLTNDGVILRASAEENSDLFYGVAGSYHSLLSITLVKVRLIPAKKWVALSYYVTNRKALAQTIVDAAIANPQPDYLDGMVIDDRRVLVMKGRQVNDDQIPHGATKVRFDRWWSPWFCQHALQRTEKIEKEEVIDLIPHYDYLFRFDRAAFWMGQFVTSPGALWRFLLQKGIASSKLPEILRRIYKKSPPNMSPSWLYRMLIGWKVSSSPFYKVLHKLPNDTFAKTYMVQDFYIPVDRANEFVDKVIEKVGIFPLWLGPMRGTTHPQVFCPHYLSLPSRFPVPDFINVGVYGIPNSDTPVEALTKELENLANAFGGRKMLYAKNYYSEKEFWQEYDKNAFEVLRKRCNSRQIPPDLFCRVSKTDS